MGFHTHKSSIFLLPAAAAAVVAACVVCCGRMPAISLNPFGRARHAWSRVPTSSSTVQRDAPAGSRQRHFLTLAMLCAWILVWYTISVSMTLYNKWLFTLYGFRFPLLVTALHFLIKVGVARVSIWLAAVPMVPLSLLDRAGRVTALIGITTAADVALSNLAFLYISVATYTIVKSGTPGMLTHPERTLPSHTNGCALTNACHLLRRVRSLDPVLLRAPRTAASQALPPPRSHHHCHWHLPRRLRASADRRCSCR